ncbi:MAG: hypothetical protein OXO50_00530 [Caldilineaceae bacterium]|nr:hypothetical protein [Caldilineaceae bacterium]
MQLLAHKPLDEQRAGQAMLAGRLFELGDVRVEQGEADLLDVAPDRGGLRLRHVFALVCGAAAGG